MCKRTKPLITRARYKKVYNKTEKEELAKNEALSTNKATILKKNKMNSTTMMSTSTEWKAPGKAQEKNNEKRKQSYNVPKTIEP